ncbi:MAG: HIRAN domain-containing protein [Pirellulaceae bacterium]
MPDIFTCPYCDQPIRFKPQQRGKPTRCPKCQHAVWVYDNASEDGGAVLHSTWQYMKERVLRKPEPTGPISDVEFLKLVDDGTIYPEAKVKSAFFTNDQWVAFGSTKPNLVRLQIEQRRAEIQRRKQAQDKQVQRDAANREKLIRAIEQAVSDGRVSLKEKEQIFAFSEKAGIPSAEVQSLLRNESEKIVQRVIADSLADGILEPHETDRITSLAASLGVKLELSKEQLVQLELAEFAWQIAAGGYTPSDMTCSVALNKNEQLIASVEAEWLDLVTLKNPAGISLGGDQYLKSMVEGECILTNKRIIVMGELSSKKMTLSSIESIKWFADGMFCNRSTGKSVFLQPIDDNAQWAKFAMLAQYIRTQNPVQALLPSETFIPQSHAMQSDVVTAEIIPGSRVDTQPRYTFRVVGEFAGNRSHHISQLNIGNPVRLIRQPDNPHDHNAVLVCDSHNRELGYLKRDVASWFAPMLDRGVAVDANVHVLLSGGGMLVGIYM